MRNLRRGPERQRIGAGYRPAVRSRDRHPAGRRDQLSPQNVPDPSSATMRPSRRARVGRSGSRLTERAAAAAEHQRRTPPVVVVFDLVVEALEALVHVDRAVEPIASGRWTSVADTGTRLETSPAIGADRTRRRKTGRRRQEGSHPEGGFGLKMGEHPGLPHTDRSLDRHTS